MQMLNSNILHIIIIGVFINVFTISHPWCTALSIPASAASFTSTTGEVVGANGRIGSFLLGSDVNYVPVPRHRNDNDDNDNGDSIRPGSFTRDGCPIFVAVPATQIPNGES